MKRQSIYAIGILLVGMLLSHATFSQSSNFPGQKIIDAEQLSDQLLQLMWT